MTIRRRGSKYVLVSRRGRTLGTHRSKAGARKQERAISVSKARRRR